MLDERIIAKHIGAKQGPLLVVFGGMHGNEPAGIRAIEMMSKMLDVEPITNPEFSLSGSFIGMIGNLQAYHAGKRFISYYLNRSWTPENLDIVEKSKEENLKDELLEIKQILKIIRREIKELNPEKIVLLDLHTTSSYGGIFSIATDDEESIKIAVGLHAPVIKGMLKGIRGTTLHFFTKENFNVDMIPITFESGQHNEDLSVNRAIAAITNCMRAIGMVSKKHVEHQHDDLLIEYSKNLPKVLEMISKHTIKNGDKFKMLPNFNNFEVISTGQLLAKDKYGSIISPDDALILMPLYQEQGEDGFFLIKKLEY